MILILTSFVEHSRPSLLICFLSDIRSRLVLLLSLWLLEIFDFCLAVGTLSRRWFSELYRGYCFFPFSHLTNQSSYLVAMSLCKLESLNYLISYCLSFWSIWELMQFILTGAKQPRYLVTADDVDSFLAIEVHPLDDRKRKVYLIIWSNQ